MIDTNRDIYIRLRFKNYLFLKSMADKKKMTASDLIKAVGLTDVSISNEFIGYIDNMKSRVNELKRIGFLFNTITKQINSNIIKRVRMDRGIVDGITGMIDESISQLLTVRNASYFIVANSLDLIPSKYLSKKNTRKLSNNKWCKIRISIAEGEFNLVTAYAKKQDVSVNKYIVEKLLILQNQSTFEKATVTNLTRSIYKIINNILNNSTQVWKNKKGNAYADEIILAKSIANKMSDYLEDLNSDPLLYKGRKFSFNHYHRVANL